MKLSIKNTNDKVLDINVNTNNSSILTLFSSDNYTRRVIEAGTGLVSVEAGLVFTNKDIAGPDNTVTCLGSILDKVYNNKHLLLYDANLELLFMIPDVTDIIGMFDLYTVDVVGMAIGTATDNKNNGVTTFGINQKFISNTKIKLDVSKLDSITATIDTLNIPGLSNPLPNSRPVSIDTINANTSVYNSHTYIVPGININFGNSIVSPSIDVGLVIGHNSRELRAKACNLPVATLTNLKAVCILD